MTRTPNPNVPVLIEVRVQLYGMSRHAVLHRPPWCGCDRRQVYPRPWRTLQVRNLADLASTLWPHDWELPLREIAHRFSLGRCDPRLPIPPHIRTLMRQEPPVPYIETLVVQDATGKHIVHDPACDCIGGIRARKTNTGTAYQVHSLSELVPLVFPAAIASGRATVDDLMASEFEVKKCISSLPLKAPEPEPYETRLETAVLRAYSALVALATTADTIDAEKTRDAHYMLEQRVQAASEGRRRPPGLLAHQLEAHLAASSEAAAWTTVRGDVAERVDGQASDADKGEAWVVCAQRVRARFRRGLETPREEPGDPVARAFAHGEHTGRLRFLRNVGDALHEVEAVVAQVQPVWM